MEVLTCVYLKTLSQVDGENSRSTLLIDVDGHNYNLNLWNPWNEIVDYIQPYTTLKLYGVKRISEKDSTYFSTDSNTIVVADPDILMNATAINNVSYCPRSYYLSEIIGESISPYIAVRGSIIHDCLSYAIMNNTKPSENLSQVLDIFSLQYENFGYSKEDVYQDLREMAECLDPFVENLSGNSLPETLFLSHDFGIRGRIDLLNNGHIFELKTGKVSDHNDARPSDITQVALYRYGLEDFTKDKEPEKGFIIYVGTNKVVKKVVEPNWQMLKYAIGKRNIAYIVSYQGYIPLILPESARKKCQRCSMKHFCYIVCAGLNQQRNCSECPHNELCTQKNLPVSYQEYFNRFSRWIREEKNESRRNFSDLWKLNVNQRVAKGKTIQNMFLENEQSENGNTKLLFSCDNRSEIREGDIVVLSDGKVLHGPVTTGVVSSVSNTSIEVHTRTIGDKMSVLDLYSINVGFRRQQRGLFNLVFKKKDFRDIIIEEKPSLIDEVKGDFIQNNQSQNKSIEKILGTQNYCLIQGPAGTGKTHVIAKAAIMLAEKGEKVLLTAFTNRAVDNICSYLLRNNYHKFIRLGFSHSILREIRDYTLSEYKERNEEKSSLSILQDFPIIVATTSTISNPIFEKIGIQTIIIDEASQMTEPTVLSALIEGDRFILVGDHKQLPPVVQSSKISEEGMSVSLFERLAKANPSNVHLLQQQFRMNEKLIEYSNKQFYDKKLSSFNDEIKKQTLSILPNYVGNYREIQNSSIYDPDYPLIFVSVKGNFQHKKKINAEEAKIVSLIVSNFLKLGLNIEQLGVICPYRGQVSEIRRLVHPQITVDTVDRFQGSDREVIILSLVESQIHGSKGFADERRLNVALTRAKKKLIVVGDPEGKQDVLENYIKYLNENAEQIDSIKTKIPASIEQDLIIVADNINKTAKILKDTTTHCLICFEQIQEDAIECPNCKSLFHIDHIVKWIRNYDRCPYCKIKLSVFLK
jgi:DNA replication ATP-dependent helicase Dna2